MFRIKIRNKKRLFLPLLDIVLEGLARAVRQENEIKYMQMGKEAAKQSLFIDNMVLHIKKS